MATSQIMISGDASQLKQDFEAIAKAAAAIGKSLSEALSGRQSDPVDELKKKIEQVQKAAESLSNNYLGKVKEKLRDIGIEFNLSEEAITRLAEKQAKAFDKQSTQSFIDSLREIQKLTGMSNEEMLKFAETFGELGKKFEPKSDLQWWLDDRMKSLAKGSDDKLASFYDNTIPDSLGKASDAFADLFMGIAQGTKSTSDLFSDMGKAIQGILSDIAADLMRVGMRLMLFGSEKSGTTGLLGGLVGGLGNWFGSMFSGGAGTVGSQFSSSFVNMSGASGMWFSKGAAFPAGALSAYSGSIVSKPTIFPFARGGAPNIGLMGEAGPEAIMPLTRGAGGRLGVDASGLGSRTGSPVYVNVVNNMGDSAGVSVRQGPAANGGVNLDVLIEQKMKSSIASGGMDSVMRNRYGARVQTVGR